MKRIVFEGNDGTGKTFRIDKMKSFFPNIEIKDRGALSKMTLEEDLFNKDNKYNESDDLLEFYMNLNGFDKDALYIICDCSEEKSQERILSRGDSIDEEYHTLEDLKKFRKRFITLAKTITEHGFNNVMVVDTEQDI